MSNGLLAEWRGRIVGRGTAAAALLAVPIAVAGVIGFNGGLGGVAGGFFAALGGPEPEAAGAVPSPGLGAALSGLAGPSGDTNDPPGRRDPTDRDPNPPGSPDDPTDPGDPNLELPDVPDVNAPVDNPQGSVDEIVDGVNNTVDDIVGNH